MTKTVICGACGKMGRVISEIISSRDDIVTIAGVDVNPVKYSDFPVVSSFGELAEFPDVVIDFSNPSALDGILGYCLTNGIAAVLATTGYTPEQIEKIRSASQSVPIFFTANMSLGINLLSELAKRAAAFLGEQFDVEIIERHHNKKIDAPSGTALMLADKINEARGGDCHYMYDRHSVRRKREPSEIGIHSVRGGTIVGEHEIVFAGRDEVITLSHSAASKEVFAVGAVNAAVFLNGRPAGLYSMSDLL